MKRGKPLVDNVSDSRQVREAGKKERLAAERHLADVRAIATTKEGKRLLWDYMDHCDVFSEIDGPLESVYFNEGRRSVGLVMLRDLVMAAPEVLVELMSEGIARDKDEAENAKKKKAEEEDGGESEEE